MKPHRYFGAHHAITVSRDRVRIDSPLLDVKGVAQLLKISEGAVYRLMRDSGLPYHRLSPRRIRLLRVEVEQWLTRQRTSEEW